MLELFSTGLMSAWLSMAGMERSQLDAVQALTWPGTPGFVLPAAPEPTTAIALQQYLKELSKKGSTTNSQGVWIQSGPVLLSSNQGTVPLPAASLTKIATSLASLNTWSPSHQFETLFAATGPIKNGVLQGDLVVIGSGDPLFIWEEGIAVGNALNRLGIKRVAGNLVIKGNFYMNYTVTAAVAGQMLRETLNAKSWSKGTTFRYHFSMPKGTPKPFLAIAGGVKVLSAQNSQGGSNNSQQILLLRHRSLTLAQILKHMNVYSNNEMAQMLATALGGAAVVRELAAEAAGVPQSEILLVNGSGLGADNRISPRAVCAMLQAIQHKLQPVGLTIADLFPVSGFDRDGTMIHRQIPNAAVVKTGTLRNVSALAGVFPTRDRGLVWFAIINRGNDVPNLRMGQDRFLQSLIQEWGAASDLPKVVLPSPSNFGDASRLGATVRNDILFGG
ncbi:D-alanyl-D-alanine carboxypeptidase [Planktothrix sp. FACHB-1355]|uniref:D-alanyl-D-alanine carboxypeptidase n=1 Tax=Aerosakkonema funiforme FACHB-1375 TaxID=2949571 RepID=A0A926VHQ3_9CYAN|nr:MULTISPECIES: D-alanyl-D-alanine carboxypeptidase [Oscillatoriales]MBD2182834.1 D-alanyl-D-alanine carboxypeptidase [Aerosakkonema funiforme FACHB-1375]MBD3562118.1 D-alanyl-D-alanine carboxypeptidase [Planktothrix sp. FACHB-1355]